MTSVVKCPGCLGEFGVDATMHGRRVECPLCRVTLTVDGDGGVTLLVSKGLGAGVEVLPVAEPVRESSQSRASADAPGQAKRKKPESSIGSRGARHRLDLFPPGFSPKTSPERASSGSGDTLPPPPDSAPPTPMPRPVVAPEPDSALPPVAAPPPPDPRSDSPLPKEKAFGAAERRSTEPGVGVMDCYGDISVVSLLPPKFLAFDPNAPLPPPMQPGENKVILPDGEGGFFQADARMVRVEQDGEVLEVYKAPREQRERRRLVGNLVAIAVGIVVLVVALSLLGR